MKKMLSLSVAVFLCCNPIGTYGRTIEEFMFGLPENGSKNILRRVYDKTPFREYTLYDLKYGEWYIDVDFDGEYEKLVYDESQFKVYKGDGFTNDVTNEMPYCMIYFHVCCKAHMAYTTFNYAEKTIYIETHMGGFAAVTRKYKRVEDTWQEVFAITPMSIINELLYPLPVYLPSYRGEWTKARLNKLGGYELYVGYKEYF